MGLIVMNLVTPKAAAKHELLFNKPTSGINLASNKEASSVRCFRKSLPYSINSKIKGLYESIFKFVHGKI
jgi:hypothetical protein